MTIQPKLQLRVLVAVFLAIGLGSCSKDIDDEASLLGSWIEESPVPDRTELFFDQGNRVTRSSTGGVNETYSYFIKGDSIHLTPQNGNDGSGTSRFFFQQIDENTLKIQNLYPSIPEMDPTFMIFERSF